MKVGQHRKELAARSTFLGRATQLALLVIASAYGLVQIVDGASYRELADNNRLRKLSIAAQRGLITDRHGRLLVENVPGYDLMLDRSLSRNLDASLDLAASIVGDPASELRQRLQAERRSAIKPVRIATRLSLDQVAQIGVRHLEHPELEIAVEPMRLYRHAHQTAHLLGYLGEVTGEQLEAPDSPYLLGDEVGKKGIEGIYEDHLRGTRGEQVIVVDSRGRLVDELEQIAASPGHNLRLSLDLRLQQTAARLLSDKVGAIVALDPHRGDVLAMLSSPSFDPNRFARGLSRDEWRQLTEDPKRPLQNRAIQNTYPPGSIFKTVLALAGLKRGLIDPKTTRSYCNGSTKIYGHRRRCWKASGHGWVDVRAALRDSCDIFFYELGKKLEIDDIANHARDFGLGSRTGIDLRNEKSGLVPTRAWSRERRGTPWYPGETISVAIGQGPILTTPLQAAVLFGALATGHRVVPRLVADPTDSEPPGQVPPEQEPLPYKAEHLEIVHQALVDVVAAPLGTGRAARVEGLSVAGKTGTAQVVAQETWTKNEDLPPEHRDHAWFASYAPAEDPKIVVVVFVEHGGGGSTAAAPLAREMYETWMRGNDP